jgi:hypothetical protein
MSNAKSNKPPSPTGKVSNHWLARLVWLSGRKKLADTSLLDTMRESRAEFVRLLGVPPEAYQADYRGFAELLQASGLSPEEERDARKALNEWRITNVQADVDVMGKLFVHYTLLAVGRPQHPGADREWIPPDALHYLHIDPDEPNVLRSKDGTAVYYSVGLIPLADWEAATSIPELEGEFIDLTPEQRAGPQEAPPDPKLGNASGVPEAPEKPAPPRKTHWMVAAGLPPFDPVHSYTLDELRTLAATYCGLHPTQGKPMGGETARRSYSRAGLWPRIPQGLWPRQKGRGGRLPD